MPKPIPGRDDAAAVGRIGRLFDEGTVSGLGEGALLERFVNRGDAPAFEALTARLGPLVMGVCRRVLVDPHDVDDAYQATFLILVRRAHEVRDRDHLGPWIYGVARRVALRARAQRARRRTRETADGVALANAVAPAVDNHTDTRELRAALDEEIGRLPAVYRTAVVLCDVEGLSHDEAARRLHCAVGTVHSRASRGRRRLRERLTRRGILMESGVIPPALLESVPTTLAAATSRIVLASGAVPAGVLTLANGVLKGMLMTSILKATTVVLSAGLLLGGAGVFARQVTSGKGEPAAVSKPDEVRQLRKEIADLKDHQAKLETQVKSLSPTPPKAKVELDEPPTRVTIQQSENTTALIGRGEGGNQFGMNNLGNLLPLKGKRFAVSTIHVGPWLAVMSSENGRMVVFNENTGKRSNYTFTFPRPTKGERITVLDLATGRQTSAEFHKGVTVLPINAGGIMGLSLSGEVIDRVTVFNDRTMRWNDQKLSPPGHGSVTPLIGTSLVVYKVGPRAYAYSTETDTWDAVTVDEASATAPIMSTTSATLGDDRRLYIFTAKSGRWETIDPDADAPDPVK